MMTQQTLDRCVWQRLHNRIDSAVAELSMSYIRKLAIRRQPFNVQKISDELNELRLGREPEYDTPGLPLVYALRYTPKRIVSIFGSLLTVLDDWSPKSVLDVGSGTGAVAVALDLLDLPHHVNLLAVEPSKEMMLFSERSGWNNRVSTTYKQGSISDLHTDSRIFSSDLIVFSACLPYDFDEWSVLITALGDYKGQESKMILVIEPDAKDDLLVSFQDRLRSRGWPTIHFCCHNLPDLIKDDTYPLPRMLSVCRRLGMDDSDSPRTWWNPPNDKFMVANPKPVMQRNTRSRTLESLSSTKS